MFARNGKVGNTVASWYAIVPGVLKSPHACGADEFAGKSAVSTCDSTDRIENCTPAPRNAWFAFCTAPWMSSRFAGSLP